MFVCDYIPDSFFKPCKIQKERSQVVWLSVLLLVVSMLINKIREDAETATFDSATSGDDVTRLSNIRLRLVCTKTT